MTLLQQIQGIRAAKKKSLAVLVDPDKLTVQMVPAFAEKLSRSAVSFILVGGSLMMGSDTGTLVAALKAHTKIPVLLFPGSAMQITPQADGILFLSLISGRNPDLLIGQHVQAAPFLKQSGLEVIPTGYMMVDGGRITTAHYISNSLPIPADKPDIAVATAMAGEMLGLKLIYLEAGSGSLNPVPTEMIAAVSSQVSLPVIVGGGIRTCAQADAAWQAGADIIVVGNALEDPAKSHLLQELSDAVIQF